MGYLFPGVVVSIPICLFIILSFLYLSISKRFTCEMLQSWWSQKSSNTSGEWLELLLNKAIIRAGDAGSQSEQEEGSERAEGKSLNSAKKTLQISESHHQIRGNRHCQCHLFYKKILLGLKKLKCFKILFTQIFWPKFWARRALRQMKIRISFPCYFKSMLVIHEIKLS